MLTRTSVAAHRGWIRILQNVICLVRLRELFSHHPLIQIQEYTDILSIYQLPMQTLSFFGKIKYIKGISTG